MNSVDDFLIADKAIRLAELKKLEQFKLIWSGVNPQPKKENPACVTCLLPVKAIFTESQIFGVFGFIPSECNQCKDKSFQDYLKREEAENYRSNSSKCCGYQNKKVKHDNKFPHFLNVTKNIKWQERVIDYAMAVCADDELKGLLLTGGTGLGKTFLMKILHNELIEIKRNTCFIKAVDLAISLRKETFGEQYKHVLHEFQTVETLIVDDYGTQKNTEWVKETIFTILDHRYENRKRTILTTNLTNEELQKVEPRLHSRLFDRDWIKAYQVAGNDLRIVY